VRIVIWSMMVWAAAGRLAVPSAMPRVTRREATAEVGESRQLTAGRRDVVDSKK
jgi:hypothetical protein